MTAPFVRLGKFVQVTIGVGVVALEVAVMVLVRALLATVYLVWAVKVAVMILVRALLVLAAIIMVGDLEEESAPIKAGVVD